MGPYQVLPVRANVDQGKMALKGYSSFLKLQHYWNLAIGLFRVIPRTLVVGGVLPLHRDAIGVFYNPSRLDKERQRLGFIAKEKKE